MRYRCAVIDDDGRRQRDLRLILGRHHWLRLLDICVRRYRPANSVIFQQGEPGGCVVMISSGRVRVVVRDGSGAEILVALRGPGDVIGEMAREPRVPRSATVTTVDDCVTHVVPAERFHDHLRRHGLVPAYHDYVASKVSEASAGTLQAARFTALRRVAGLLWQYVVLTERASGEGLRVPFTQEQIARDLGLVRSTVAAQLATLRRVGVLSEGRSLVIGDADALEAVARGDAM